MRGARAPLFLMRGNEVVSEQVKVENQFARISRLRKFVISKSQNPKI